MLLTIAIVLFALWALGLATHILGAFIHVVLVIGLVLLIMHFVRGRSTAV